MRRYILTALISITLFLGFWAPAAVAHESRPLFIEVTERESGLVEARWRTPPSVPEFNVPAVTLPACDAVSPVGTSATMAGPMGQRLFACDQAGNSTVEITYPVMNPSISTLLRFNRANGETYSVLAGPKEMSIALPKAPTAGQVVREYFRLGVEHILTGYDHLLFVACLILIAGTLRRMLITITGFTLAHSLTLALAALEVVRVPVPPVEAVIALSIVFLATELARNKKDTLTWRYPIAVSSSFGLLHGFGFASVLGEIGVPQAEVTAALFSFNVGVEAGQIAFVLVAIAIFHAARRLWQKSRNLESSVERAVAGLERPAGYVVGTLAAFWFVDRISGFF